MFSRGAKPLRGDGVLRASRDQRRSRARIRGTQGCSHIDDRGSDPFGSSMASTYLYSAPITGQIPRRGTPMISGAGQLCEAPREGCGLPEARLLQPRQSDLRRIHIPAAKDALRSVHRHVYHCPVSVQFDKSAAGDGPTKDRRCRNSRGAASAHNRTKPSRPSLVGRHARPSFPRDSGIFCSLLRIGANGAEGRHRAHGQGQAGQHPRPNQWEAEAAVLHLPLGRLDSVVAMAAPGRNGSIRAHSWSVKSVG